MSKTSLSEGRPASPQRRGATELDAHRALVTLLVSHSDADFAAVEWRHLDVLSGRLQAVQGSSPMSKKAD